MLRLAAAVVALAGLTACAETAADRSGAATGSMADTSAQSPMTVNPAPPGTTPAAPGQPRPSTPPTLTEDPAGHADDTAMPPGPVNPPT